MSDYDAANPTLYTLAECEAAVGRRATLVLTGQIVEARVGDEGPFVMFAPDERFGFGQFRLGIDLEALEFRA